MVINLAREFLTQYKRVGPSSPSPAWARHLPENTTVNRPEEDLGWFLELECQRLGRFVKYAKARLSLPVFPDLRLLPIDGCPCSYCKNNSETKDVNVNAQQ